MIRVLIGVCIFLTGLATLSFAATFRVPTAEELRTLRLYGLHSVDSIDEPTAKLLHLTDGSRNMAEIQKRGNSPRIKGEGKKVCPEFASRLSKLIKKVEERAKDRKVCIDSLMRTQTEQDRNCRTGKSGFGGGQSCNPAYGSAHQIGLAADFNCSLPCYPKCGAGAITAKDKEFMKILHEETQSAGLTNPVLRADPFHVEMSRDEAKKSGCPTTPDDFAKHYKEASGSPQIFEPTRSRTRI